jgi:hypothetical protein
MLENLENLRQPGVRQAGCGLEETGLRKTLGWRALNGRGRPAKEHDNNRLGAHVRRPSPLPPPSLRSGRATRAVLRTGGARGTRSGSRIAETATLWFQKTITKSRRIRKAGENAAMCGPSQTKAPQPLATRRAESDVKPAIVPAGRKSAERRAAPKLRTYVNIHPNYDAKQGMTTTPSPHVSSYCRFGAHPPEPQHLGGRPAGLRWERWSRRGSARAAPARRQVIASSATKAPGRPAGGRHSQSRRRLFRGIGCAAVKKPTIDVGKYSRTRAAIALWTYLDGGNFIARSAV